MNWGVIRPIVRDNEFLITFDSILRNAQEILDEEQILFEKMHFARELLA